MRQIPGFENIYAVDHSGNVWRVGAPRARPLRPGLRNGYPFVVLSVGGSKKAYSVHCLVLLAYRGPRPPGMEPRHLNGVRTDNRLRNLRWGTKAENVRDNQRNGVVRKGEACTQSKLTEAQVREIRAATKGIRRMGAVYGVARSTIDAVRSRRNWKHLT